MKNHVTLLLFLSIILACSTDDNLTESETTEQEFVKSRTFTNLPSDAPNYNEFYSYNNGLLM